MKKVVLMIVFLGANLSLFAQDTQNEASIKPQAGSFTAEVNFSPLSSNPVYINYLRFRYFNGERSAVRLGAFIGLTNEKPDNDVTQSTFELNLRPGYEWHFAGTDRLSPYIGIEADIAFKNSKYEDSENDFEIEGAWDDFGTEQGFTRFGANFIVGVDYYVAKRLYLGTEIGFGFESIKYKDIKATQGGNTVGEIDGGSTFQIGPNFNSAIRLGFVF